MNPVFITQMVIIHAILGVRQTPTTGGLFKNFGILKLKDISKYVIVTYEYRTLSNSNLADFLFQLYNRNTMQSNQNLISFPNWVLICCTWRERNRVAYLFNGLPLAHRQR